MEPLGGCTRRWPWSLAAVPAGRALRFLPGPAGAVAVTMVPAR